MESKYIPEEQVGYLCLLIKMLNINICKNVTNKSGSLILVIVLYETFCWTSAFIPNLSGLLPVAARCNIRPIFQKYDLVRSV